MLSVLSGDAHGEWWASAVFTGILTGAANAVIYLLIVFAGGALFGIEFLSAS